MPHVQIRLKETTLMATSEPIVGGPDDVLKELQRAVAEHSRILGRQEELIKRLRDELKGVDRD